MGLFDSITDVFTGAPAKKAAAENQARLQQNQTQGLGYLEAGKTGALSALGTAAGAYQPLQQKYGQGTGLYLDSLGVNGAEGNTRATGAYQAGPGYQYAVDQSLDQTRRAAARDGGLVGGNTLAALSDRAGNMANQEYGNWQARLGGLVAPELAATSGYAGMTAAQAPVYTGTANSQANLGTATTTGMNDQTTQAANAQMAGSKNLWGLGIQGATALASGGTSLLGGGGGAGLGSLFMGGGSPTGYGR
ncbi:MAG: hypothetical protein H0U63_04645 [Burkholderiales bacterium]|nr:hypothetical protein [Burkholderiales bacterium]